MQSPDITIPPPATPPEDVSELTAMEIADLSASKRGVVIYERTIKDLQSKVNSLFDHNRSLQEKVLKKQEQLNELPQLKRAKTELYVQFICATILMTLGSTLISSYPLTVNHVPWQFATGWTLIALGCALVTIIRPLTSTIFHKFVHKQNEK